MKLAKRTWAEINISALGDNIKNLQSLIGDKKILAVVKANAYGHDITIVAPALWEMGIRHFAVSSISEATQLRELLPDGEILVFGYADSDEITDFRTIYSAISLEEARELNAFGESSGQKIRTHIKIDTGMTRTGISTADELEEVLRLPHILAEGIYTHFPTADSAHDDDILFTNHQQQKLIELAKDRSLAIHTQNSAGVLYHKEYEGDFVRAGIAMYGYCPNVSLQSPVTLKPILEMKSVVWQIRKIKKGTPIGYARTFVAPEEMTIAVIPLGYADGYSRRLSGSGSVIIRGQSAPIVGRICMDQTMVDVSGIKSIAVGDEVTVYSPKYKDTDIDQIATKLDTISYEILCDISARVPRIVV